MEILHNLFLFMPCDHVVILGTLPLPLVVNHGHFMNPPPPPSLIIKITKLSICTKQAYLSSYFDRISTIQYPPTII